MKKRFLAVILALALCVGLVPTTAFAADSDFVIENGVLTSYNGPGGNVTIPDSVTSIGEFAFGECTSLTSVTIPNSVTDIGNHAFFGCEALDSVTIPSSVEGINALAFAGCTGLTSVTISDGVSVIGMSAFNGCTSLTSVTIPDSVTLIADFAFAGCTSLTSVSIPSSVERIDSRAFLRCTGLTGISVDPNNPNYTSVDGVLFDKDRTVLYAYPAQKQETTYTIPSSVNDINEGAFYGCAALTSVTIPSSVTYIESVAFSGCTGLTNVTIPSSVTYIGRQAFYHTGLTSVNIPSSVTELDGSVFAACWSLPGISVDPNNPNYTSVDGVLFSKDMTVLHTYPAGKQGTAYTIPSSVTSIDFDAFNNCYSLVSVSIPNSVTSIGGSAFGACWRLTSVTIPFSVTSISNYTFSGCLYLTSVNIPSSVTTIGSGAFNNCGSLTDVYYGGSEAQWNLIEISDSNEALETAAIHHSSTLPAIATFSDVKSTGYYLEAVDWAVEKGITTGKTGTTFAPGENCTHGQILTFLWRAAGEPVSDVTLPFETTGNEYYLGAAKWAYENGMIGADFSHKTPCTRADAVNYIWQAFGKETASYDGRFTDVSADSPYAAAVAWAVDNGVTTGATETTFNPSGICNRGQIVTFLHRAYK